MRNALRKQERELARKLAPEAVEPPEGLLARLKADIPDELPQLDRHGDRDRDREEATGNGKVLRFPAWLGALGGSTALKAAATVALAVGGGFLALQVWRSTPEPQLRQAEEAVSSRSETARAPQAPAAETPISDDLGDRDTAPKEQEESLRGAIRDEMARGQARRQTRSGSRAEQRRAEQRRIPEKKADLKSLGSLSSGESEASSSREASGRTHTESGYFVDSVDRPVVAEPAPPAEQPVPEPESPIHVAPSIPAPPPPPARPAPPPRQAAPKPAPKDATKDDGRAPAWVGSKAPLTFRGGSPRSEDEGSSPAAEIDPEVMHERLRHLPASLREGNREIQAETDLVFNIPRAAEPAAALARLSKIRDLEIQVRHVEGEALPGTVLHLQDAEGQERVAVAGREGRAYFYDVPVGEYHVRAELQGFQDVARRVTPQEAEERELEMSMPLAVLDEIEVVAESPSAAVSVTRCGTGETMEMPTTCSATLRVGPVADAFGNRVDRPPVPENPLVDTAYDPLSTFGLDVDTGSYGLLRRHLTEGTLPDPRTVRIEELLNAFDYGDPAPTRGDFAITAQGAPSPFRPGLFVLRLGIKAREVQAEDRKPAALTFVVDVSGSMQQPDKLDLAKQALGLLLDQLEPGDTVALVTYGSEAQVVLPHTADKEAVRRALHALGDGGSTNAEAGLVLGYEEARKAFRPGAVNRIVLCSDGVANVGVTDSEGLLERVGREARRGIELTTLGFGMGQYNDALMEQLADRGDGRYAYLDDIYEAYRVLVEELTGTIQTVARDARVQFELNPRTVKRYRLLGYENRDIADHRFRYDEQDAGEIGSGHAVTVLYELELEPAVADTASLGILRLRWWSTETEKFEEIGEPVYRRKLARNWQQAAPSLRWAALTTRFAQALRGQASMRELPQLAHEMHGLASQAWSNDERRAELADMAQVAEQIHRGILQQAGQTGPQSPEEP